jgi:hypothetical protein
VVLEIGGSKSLCSEKALILYFDSKLPCKSENRGEWTIDGVLRKILKFKMSEWIKSRASDV